MNLPVKDSMSSRAMLSLLLWILCERSFCMFEIWMSVAFHVPFLSHYRTVTCHTAIQKESITQ